VLKPYYTATRRNHARRKTSFEMLILLSLWLVLAGVRRGVYYGYGRWGYVGGWRWPRHGVIDCSWLTCWASYTKPPRIAGGTATVTWYKPPELTHSLDQVSCNQWRGFVHIRFRDLPDRPIFRRPTVRSLARPHGTNLTVDDSAGTSMAPRPRCWAGNHQTSAEFLLDWLYPNRASNRQAV